jgi:hypothetical protein
MVVQRSASGQLPVQLAAFVQKFVHRPDRRQLGGGLHCSVRPVWVRAGEPLRRATLSQSLYPELSIRSFSKLD